MFKEIRFRYEHVRTSNSTHIEYLITKRSIIRITEIFSEVIRIQEYNVILFVTVTNKDFFKSNKGTENNINNSIEVVASKDFLPFGDSIPCSYRLSLVLETKLVIMPHPRHKERRKGFE